MLDTPSSGSLGFSVRFPSLKPLSSVLDLRPCPDSNHHSPLLWYTPSTKSYSQSLDPLPLRGSDLWAGQPAAANSGGPEDKTPIGCLGKIRSRVVCRVSADVVDGEGNSVGICKFGRCWGSQFLGLRRTVICLHVRGTISDGRGARKISRRGRTHPQSFGRGRGRGICRRLETTNWRRLEGQHHDNVRLVFGSFRTEELDRPQRKAIFRLWNDLARAVSTGGLLPRDSSVLPSCGTRAALGGKELSE